MFRLCWIFLSLVFADSAEQFTNVASLDFSIRTDIRYATEKNITKRAIYPEAICVLRRPVAEALVRAQSTLKLQGFTLKVFDCYRPHSLQLELEKILSKGSKKRVKVPPHDKGASVDVTLESTSGSAIEMPSDFGDQKPKKLSKKAQRNLKILQKALAKEGFSPSSEEWWHFDFAGLEKFEVGDYPFSLFR